MDGSGGGGGYRSFSVNFPNPILPPFPPVIVHRRYNHQEILPFPERFGSSSFHGSASSTNSLLPAADAATASWLSHLQNVNFGGSRGSFPHGLVAPPPASWGNQNPEMMSAAGSPEETRREKGHDERRSSNGVAFIKGQWTEEEDRLLIRLVNEHGDRRWSVIATKIVGRAGKQCRERWHNHLRPDIKKESWSERDERLLVQVHEQLGNRWSEIAKRIPGRSENSIKNHWNATKRRQFSKRRMRSSSLQDAGSSRAGGRRRSVVLENYIKFKYFSGLSLGQPGTSLVPEQPSIQQQVNVDIPPPQPLPPAAAAAAAAAGDEQDSRDSPSILTETYDDEVNFMQKLFGNSSSSSTSPTAANNGSRSNNTAEFAAFGWRTNEVDSVPEEDSWSTYLASDPNLYEMGGADQINSSTPQAPAANNTNSGAGYGSAAASHCGAPPLNRWSSSATAAAMDMDLMDLVSAASSSRCPHGYGSCCTKTPRQMF
ncbi:PREDICTED: myb-like protein A [Ipomoea nil]|uniref:myb-like protein A n=1 Tax=Ipomoea nil TaxID=35883 RepID=UPI000900D2C7|nr:PREDICTED: myb-like protein A [Ipomoea nil]